MKDRSRFPYIGYYGLQKLMVKGAIKYLLDCVTMPRLTKAKRWTRSTRMFIHPTRVTMEPDEEIEAMRAKGL